MGFLSGHNSWVRPDVTRRVLQHQDLLVGKGGVLMGLVDTPAPDVAALGDATHCLRCLAVRWVPWLYR